MKKLSKNEEHRKRKAELAERLRPRLLWDSSKLGTFRKKDNGGKPL